MLSNYYAVSTENTSILYDTWKKEWMSSSEFTQTECFVRKHVLMTYREDYLESLWGLISGILI